MSCEEEIDLYHPFYLILVFGLRMNANGKDATKQRVIFFLLPNPHGGHWGSKCNAACCTPVQLVFFLLSTGTVGFFLFFSNMRAMTNPATMEKKMNGCFSIQRKPLNIHTLYV